jgi:hypothetical protein
MSESSTVPPEPPSDHSRDPRASSVSEGGYREEHPAPDRDPDEQLDELAEDLRRPHDDEQERRRRQAAADRAGRSPRRQGEGIHPGSH